MLTFISKPFCEQVYKAIFFGVNFVDYWFRTGDA